MTPEELRSRSSADLQTTVKDLQEEFFKLKVQKSTGQLEKTHRLKELKRDIARVHTLLKEMSKKDQKK